MSIDLRGLALGHPRRVAPRWGGTRPQPDAEGALAAPGPRLHPPVTLQPPVGRPGPRVTDAPSADPPRALLTRAGGRVGPGGVDGKQSAGRGAEGGHALWTRLLGFTQRIEALPCPSVFSAHALCLTWGLEIALGCDLLIASPKAKFGLGEKVVGLTPSMGGTQRLAARAGGAMALALSLIHI